MKQPVAEAVALAVCNDTDALSVAKARRALRALASYSMADIQDAILQALMDGGEA